MRMFTQEAIRLFAIITMICTAGWLYAEDACIASERNETAIQEVLDGKRKIADAAWWGFNKEDSTEILQAAIDSGAPKVVVPFRGDPWIVRPITLRDNLELVFEPGVLVLAKKDEFHGGGDSLFSAVDKQNVTIRGYGAILRMRKKDYQSEAYQRAEWRMGLRFMGCKNVLVEGVRVESSGGDGIYVGSSGKLRWCEDVTIRDSVCHDNHRQGISVISAQNLLIENCVFSGTDGTAPEAGIDLEPDSPDERLVNCVIRNCIMENNQGHEILVYLKPFTNETEPVSIYFENCHSRMGYSAGLQEESFTDESLRGWSGMAVGAVRDNGPQGIIEFRNCTSENTGKEGAKVFDKSADGVLVRFVNCSWKSPWVSRFRDYGGPRVPVLLHLRRTQITKRLGGIEFIDCTVFDDVFRPVLRVEENETMLGVRDLRGKITVHSPHDPRVMLGPDPKNVQLQVEKAPE